MSSRLYLVAYDISDPKRLTRVHRFLKERALALQYSVFVLEGSEELRQTVQRGIEARIDPVRDDVRMYALPEGVEVQPLGAAEPLPDGVVLVGVGGAGRLPVRSGAKGGAE